MQSRFLYLAFAVSLMATAGSLFFSVVMHLPPCNLCWWQRICMYPLVYILGLGIIVNDQKVARYAIGPAIFGWIIALYHNLIYFDIISPDIIPCTSGVSCTSKQIEWFGFLSIPLMSFWAFSLLIVFLILAFKNKEK